MDKFKKNNEIENVSIQLGKMPPQAIDMEEAVLGVLIQYKDSIEEVISLLKRESFYKTAHKTIYEEIVKLYSSNTEIDLLTV